MGFLRQEYWSWLPFPSPGDLSYPGTEPVSPVSAGQFFTTESPGKLTKRIMKSILNVAKNKHSVKYKIVILNPNFTFKTLGELLKMITLLAPHSVMI